MKKISIIGTVGVPACYGGFESLIENLLDYTPSNILYTVYCSSKKYTSHIPVYKGAKLQYLNLSANGLSSILYDIISMWKSRNSDIILILGVSGCLFLPIFRFFYHGKLITNIDGIEWKRAKWNKLARFILHQSERLAVCYSNIVVGDNQAIIDYLSKAYNKKAELITYGGDQVLNHTDLTITYDYSFAKGKYAVSVCRIEPENNIHLILEAFSYQNEIPIVIVGNWNASEYGRNLRLQYNNIDRLYLLDPIYDSYKINWIRRNSSIYIHGHSAGGTNPSLVEAMSFGLPILAYDCVYNRATTYDLCLYWSNSLELMHLIASDHDKLDTIAMKMKEISQVHYKWENVAQKYIKLFLL